MSLSLEGGFSSHGWPPEIQLAALAALAGWLAGARGIADDASLPLTFLVLTPCLGMLATSR